MSDEVAKYLQSAKNFAAAHARAKNASDQIVNMASALQYKLEEYLHFNCDRRMRNITQERYVDAIRFEPARWPSGEAIRTLMAEFSDSFHAMTQAWHQVPQADRAGLNPPPTKLSL